MLSKSIFFALVTAMFLYLGPTYNEHEIITLLREGTPSWRGATIFGLQVAKTVLFYLGAFALAPFIVKGIQRHFNYRVHNLEAPNYISLAFATGIAGTAFSMALHRTTILTYAAISGKFEVGWVDIPLSLTISFIPFIISVGSVMALLLAVGAQRKSYILGICSGLLILSWVIGVMIYVTTFPSV